MDKLPFDDFLENEYDMDMKLRQPRTNEDEFEDPVSKALTEIERKIEFAYECKELLRIWKTEGRKNPAIYEDELCRTLTDLESSIEKSVITNEERTLDLQETEPDQPDQQTGTNLHLKPQGARSNHPYMQNRFREAFRFLSPWLAHDRNGIRPSRTGMKIPSDVYCELKGERIEHTECIDSECEYWNEENQGCDYGKESD